VEVAVEEAVNRPDSRVAMDAMVDRSCFADPILLTQSDFTKFSASDGIIAE
jgi:hypothetical protein